MLALRTHDRLTAIGYAVAYFAVATITIYSTRFNGGVALVWGATAILLTYLITHSRDKWALPLILCGVLSAVATTFVGLGGAAALPFSIINLSEALGSALILRTMFPRGLRMESAKEIVALLVVAGVIMPIVCGAPAGLTSSTIKGTSFLRDWFDFATGHSLGAVALTPLLLYITSGHARTWLRNCNVSQGLEAGALLLCVLASSIAAFRQSDLPLLFLPLLPMMIFVFRMGRIGALVSITVLLSVAVAFTLSGQGPISAIRGSTGLHAQFLQFYLAAAVLTVLPAAADLKSLRLSYSQIQELSAVARLVLDRIGDIIMHLEVDGTIRYVSPSAFTITGHRSETLVGNTPHGLIHPEDLDEVVRIHRLALSAPSDTFIVEYRCLHADGQYEWHEVHTRATLGEDGDASGVVSIIREISKRKNAELQLMRAAQTDPLTNVLNRRSFDAELERRAGADPSEPFTLVMFDLDHFKSINDSYGHQTGDIVIQDFADRLRSELRRCDVIARVGGEEFVAILDGTDLVDAHEVCERLRLSFAQRSHQLEGGGSFQATVSGGIASFRPGMSPAEILSEADAALYFAKSIGRNRLVLAA